MIIALGSAEVFRRDSNFKSIYYGKIGENILKILDDVSCIVYHDVCDHVP